MNKYQLKLLLVVPHPDDEVYGAGGTLLEWETEGCGVLTLTRGEAGRTGGLCEPEELASFRQQELAACLRVLGVRVHEQHSFPDKYLAQYDFSELVAVIRESITRLKPEIVLTFPPDGSNGHPDHVTTHRAARAAWESLPEPRPVLWYYASPRPQHSYAAAEMHALLPNLTRDVTPFVTRKLEAIAQHRSQALSSIDFMRRHPERITQETFFVVDASD